MQDGSSYQIVDESDQKKSKLTTELGVSLGYRLTNALRFYLGYNGKYSPDLTNNTISLEGSLRF
jgi:hypothetical protein